MNIKNEFNTFYDDEIKTFQFFKKINFSMLKKINKAILEKDFSIEPVLYLNCYYFNFDEEIAVHLYDDRWIDIISRNNKILENIKIKFDKNVKINYERYY